MEATPLQIVGCAFSPQPAAQRIDDVVLQMRRERAVVTAKTVRQATFVKFGASDARLIELACRAAGSPAGASLRFGFACSVSGRAQAKDGVRVSTRALAQATDLATAARDGEVLLSPDLASLLAKSGFALASRPVNLPGGRAAVACPLEAISSNGAKPVLDERPALDQAQDADAGQGSEDFAPADRVSAARAEAMQEAQRDLESRQHVVMNQMAHASERLERLTAQMAALAQTIEQAQHAVATLEQRLARSRDDQQFVLARCAEVAELRGKVEDLIGRLDDTDGKIVQIESRRKVVEEVQSRAEGITHMLDDIHLNLEMLSEQRAVVDDVGEKLARLEFTVQEAHNTLRALQREREVAERIEQGIKALRARSGAANAR